jgi:CRP-like cAMP-binding protein
VIESIKKEETILSLCEDVVLPEQCERVVANSFIVNQGQPIKQAYIIKSGIFKIGVSYQQSVFTIAYLVPGDLLGFTGMFQSLNYPYFVKAVTNADMYLWEMSRIFDLLELMPEISKNFKKNHSALTGRIIERMKSFVFLTPYQRVAAWVADYHKVDKYHKNNIWSVLSIKDMAEYCNVGSESFIMYLEELERNKIIELSDSDCKIVNWEKLASILNGTA